MSEEAADYCLVKQYDNKKQQIVQIDEILVCGENNNYDKVATKNDIINAGNGINNTLRIISEGNKVAVFVEKFGKKKVLKAFLRESKGLTKRNSIPKRKNFTPVSRPLKTVKSRKIVLEIEKKNSMKRKDETNLRIDKEKSPDLSIEDKQVSLADTEIMSSSGSKCASDEEMSEEGRSNMKSNDDTKLITKALVHQELEGVKLTEPSQTQEEKDDASYPVIDDSVNDPNQIRQTKSSTTEEKVQVNRPKPVIKSDELMSTQKQFEVVNENKKLIDRIKHLRRENTILRETVQTQENNIDKLRTELEQEQSRPIIIQMAKDDFHDELKAMEDRIYQKIHDFLGANPNRPNENQQNNQKNDSTSAITFGRFGLPAPDKENMIEVTEGKMIHEKYIASAIREADYRKRVNHIVVGWWSEKELLNLGFVQKDGKVIELIDSDTVEKIHRLCCQLDGKNSNKTQPSKEDVQSWISRKITYFKGPRMKKKNKRYRKRHRINVIDDSDEDESVGSHISERQNSDDSDDENNRKKEKFSDKKKS
ncbi:hypothetical protein KQX54_014903 [Cotesia glomerata]|uniref:Uncharacterized protein n=1 Tax=Cotesia glomerata TaxID=32391 RepID=A0AAV7ISQ0_COTGL|nr:hypothetical protein KQX54_014903 [Cotesia glomerata]